MTILTKSRDPLLASDKKDQWHGTESVDRVYEASRSYGTVLWLATSTVHWLLFRLIGDFPVTAHRAHAMCG
jgi:hypothetical protein